ncbi:multidrug efflux pump subunit AcrA (membrane-fusion protein) [Chryseobacterium ginsenosidimutans]|uniref:efflux RND transporter periplasmic adaptor subunit n=1 Tax=Chryseobacterium ginsenosidimutans TaxID=687846 RepID=UPI002786B6CE|nr:efflux RND transporter periplasmic adaptor subunit [Chryseobacterium ginsenosidimutans]MDQ0595191.1 multidrug efflux pump subunit AcrA (membrane-fusion protein) [Chryseobacterium ginsenosidimutans]
MKKVIALIIWSLVVLSCNKTVDSPPAEAAATETKPKTLVTVAYPSDTAQLNNIITLNATATYLLKSDVKANSTGYITKITIKQADHVGKGSVLFGLQTKEARALGNTINKLDKSFRFNGATTVTSPATGYVAMLNHQIGDYVQDGEVLATITDSGSFGFVVDVPYEYLQIIKTKGSLPITLPDNTILQGTIAKVMPSVDAISQTVKVLLQVPTNNIPENLIATVSFSKTSASGLSVPKMAVVSDETQSSFWVMKLINDTTAIKTDITKGLETDQYIQIQSGNLTTKDRVIVSGNFGLSDTATVKIQNP